MLKLDQLKIARYLFQQLKLKHSEKMKNEEFAANHNNVNFDEIKKIASSQFKL